VIGDLEERLALALARSWVPSPPLSRVERQLQRRRLAHRLELMATEWGERREETAARRIRLGVAGHAGVPLTGGRNVSARSEL
jgi:hypothetical protein